MQIYEIGLVVNRIVGGLSAWLAQLTARTHQNIAIVALANRPPSWRGWPGLLLLALSGTLLSLLFGAPVANRV
jgi:hypothetical protein